MIQISKLLSFVHLIELKFKFYSVIIKIRISKIIIIFFWLNHVLLILILDVDTQVNKHYFSIRNENAPQHTDIVWKGLVLQTCTWKWTAVITFAVSCISNISINSNNSSNNVIIAINNSSSINNSELQRKRQTFIKSNEKWRSVDRLIKCCKTDHWMKKYKLPLDSKYPAFF